MFRISLNKSKTNKVKDEKERKDRKELKQLKAATVLSFEYIVLISSCFNVGETGFESSYLY